MTIPNIGIVVLWIECPPKIKQKGLNICVLELGRSTSVFSMVRLEWHVSPCLEYYGIHHMDMCSRIRDPQICVGNGRKPKKFLGPSFWDNTQLTKWVASPIGSGVCTSDWIQVEWHFEKNCKILGPLECTTLPVPWSHGHVWSFQVRRLGRGDSSDLTHPWQLPWFGQTRTHYMQTSPYTSMSGLHVISVNYSIPSMVVKNKVWWDFQFWDFRSWDLDWIKLNMRLIRPRSHVYIDE